MQRERENRRDCGNFVIVVFGLIVKSSETVILVWVECYLVIELILFFIEPAFNRFFFIFQDKR